MKTAIKDFLKRFLPVPARTHNAQVKAMTEALASISKEVAESNTNTMLKLEQQDEKIRILLKDFVQTKQLTENLTHQAQGTEARYQTIENNINFSVDRITTALVASKNQINEHIAIGTTTNNTEIKDHIVESLATSKTEIKNYIVESLAKSKAEIYNNVATLSRTSNAVVNDRISKSLTKTKIEHMDFRLADHCNLNCKGCSTFSPIATKRFADPEVFRSDLTQLHALIGDNIMRIHLLGGEPLLHPQVEQFAIISRSIFHYVRIDFTTNGLLVKDMPPSFWETMRNNDIALKYTRYPIDLDYDEMVDFVQSKGVAVFSAGNEIKYFRRIPLNAKGTFNSSQSYLLCPYADCIQLRDGKLYRCTASASVDLLNNAMASNSQSGKFYAHPADSLDIYQAKTKDEVMDFLYGSVPFCQYCDMNQIDSYVPWGGSKRDISEWIDIR